MILELLLISIALIAASGSPGLLLGRRMAAGQWIAALLNAAGSAVGFAALWMHYRGGGGASQLAWPWAFPGGGQARVGLDDLSAIFLVPMLLISALGSIYGLEYWKQSRHPGNGRKLRLFWGLMTAGMMGVVVARDAYVLLFAWEVMALSAFFLVSTEERRSEVRRAGWIYLVATHVGTLCLFAHFALLRAATGSFALWSSAPAQVSQGLSAGIFITGVMGFGLKAGLMPLHVWLPGAHANAPSHVSAILSGVLLKAGVYGIIRLSAFLPHPPLWWGATLLVAGCVSGLLGILFAIAQHDFKRLLAYSSIENIGIITIGIGLALLGRSTGRPAWVALGLGGALLHVLNHSLFKPLLFLGAGSLLHATHTRRMDLLGGLGKSMPRTFAWMLVGAVAICGLPPFNGFVSEFLIYAGLFHALDSEVRGAIVGAALAAPALALIGALSLATFVKLLGAVFAGPPRYAAPHPRRDPGVLMRGPMAVLGLCCAGVGLAPQSIANIIQRGIVAWSGDPAARVTDWAPLNWISGLGIVLLVSAVAAFILMRRVRARRPMDAAGTWDCGYVRPTARMQYTGSSFGQALTDLFGWVLLPRKAIVALRGLFPRRERFDSEVPDVVLDRGVVPAMSFAERLLAWARPLQRGMVHVYLLYVLAALLALLLFASWR